MDEKDTLRRREESLRAAWAVLQTFRQLIEANRGEPLPVAKEKSIVEEGTILIEALREDLAKLHLEMQGAAKAADWAWEQAHGGPVYTKTPRLVKEAKDSGKASQSAHNRIHIGPKKLQELLEQLKR